MATSDLTRRTESCSSLHRSGRVGSLDPAVGFGAGRFDSLVDERWQIQLERDQRHRRCVGAKIARAVATEAVAGVESG
ncbi:hypothetical protein TIFTF001_050019 [Ficus carica]|uniref:Uncharacterized protein n=1 Tax=Ficus carica TaxID=3494 RepID=A0AA87Z768_FICCA|nr:hypothetical protein TIFTF001_050019 [Ficus carica]